MIVRVWRGLTRPGRAGDYRRHLANTVFPELAALPGHRGAFLLQREAAAGETGGEGTEVLAVTLWDDLAAIEAFAGGQVDRAVVEPQARSLLLRFEDRVAHYEVALAANLPFAMD